jgi:hypothetical protein
MKPFEIRTHTNAGSVLDFIDHLGLQSSRQEYVYSNDDVPSSYWY